MRLYYYHMYDCVVKIDINITNFHLRKTKIIKTIYLTTANNSTNAYSNKSNTKTH